jgi:formylglycine-generating enzyme required for sulfatase activity
MLKVLSFTILLACNGWAQSAGCASTDLADMVLIHGGTIQVGIDKENIPRFVKLFGVPAQLFQDELPKHSVSVNDFCLDKHLVTNAQFKRFVDATPEWRSGRVSPQFDNGNYLRHWKNSDALASRTNHPVVNVNWYAGFAYCHWQGKRLPTEAEWEYAARGGQNALFPWGNAPADPRHANFGASHIGTTTPVGRYPANGYGLFDMAGNVWESLADEWEPYPSTPQKTPVRSATQLPDSGSLLKITTRRVIRGGSFDGAAVNLWVEYRDSHPPNGSRDFVGFRCAR